MNDTTKITYATGICSLGCVLVAETDSGVCAVLIGDGPKELILDLHARFKGAAISQDSDARSLERILGAIETPRGEDEFELDLRGTEFQQRVWQELRRIPCGDTTSYSRIAERIGSPRSVRAVAGAIAANPVAVIIPCHRIVRSDGSLSGYRWGPERKRTLLEREGALR